ncbi:MAG: EAL domain-containing protein [Pseudomonadota bacterium]
MSQQPIIETIRLLLLHESQDEAELLLNTLRKAGKATRADFARNEESLVTLLKGAEWDALIARPSVGGCTPDKAVAQVRKSGREIPVIVLSDDNQSATILAGLKAGARDVVPRGETERLLLVLDREMGNLSVLREKRRLEGDLRESEKRSEMLLDTAQDAVAYVTDGMHVEENGAYLELFGYTDPDELAGVPIMDLVAESSHKDIKEALRLQRSAKPGDKHEVTVTCLHTDGHPFEAKMTFSQAVYDGEPCTQILIRTSGGGGLSDAELEARLKEAASQDMLTGLRSRQFFMEQVENAVAAAKNKKKITTVVFIQLDDFPKLRTTVGIGGADTVLTALATTLRGLVPENNGVLARFGDDVFTALVAISDLEKAQAFAEKIRKTIDETMFDVQKRSVHVTASIGAALIEETIPAGQDALSYAADAAVKVRQKNSNGNGVFVHNPADLIDSSTDAGMAKHLQTALEKNQFRLYYQPVLNLEDNAEETYEVLLRMPFKDKELQPADFMQAAAAGNLNTKIDRWVILNSLKVLAEHNAKGHKTRIMVTLTTDSLADASLVQWLGVALKAAKIGGESLILQFTEADAATYLKPAAQFTKDVRALKVQTAVSRFGASHAPSKVLSHLVDVTHVKLDGSFMQELGTDAGKQSIAKCIKEVQGHGKKVIASHVETAGALQVLWGYGINYIQGFYISAPMAAMEYPFSEQ